MSDLRPIEPTTKRFGVVLGDLKFRHRVHIKTGGQLLEKPGA
jgi:hypothetical protein